MCREWHYTEKEGESERDLGQISFDTMGMIHRDGGGMWDGGTVGTEEAADMGRKKTKNKGFENGEHLEEVPFPSPL